MQLLVQNFLDPSRATEFFVPKRRIFAWPKIYSTEIKVDNYIVIIATVQAPICNHPINVNVCSRDNKTSR